MIALEVKRSKLIAFCGVFFLNKVQMDFFLYHENNKRHGEKKKTLSSSSCHSTLNKRVTTALNRRFRVNNAWVVW